MSTSKSRAYLSPRHSPALGYGSPAMSQGNWTQQSQESSPRSRSILSSSGLGEQSMHPYNRSINHSQPPPLPQQHDSTFVPTTSDYTGHSIYGTPLSPPASDGLMSPPTNDQEFSDKPVDSNMPNMWMSNHYGMKGEGDSGSTMPMSHHGSQSPILCIEDILRENNQPLHPPIGPGGYLDENGFGISRNMKRERTDYLTAAAAPSYPQSAVDTGTGARSLRKKRRLTEASEANFNCKKCGKYFSRIWNFNAHQETHDPDRPRPHVCPYRECSKAFVRRTDLIRHTQCVHAKDKKFKCELCGNMFARKDTLRRHEDDGCPQRVDIVSRNSKHKPLVMQSQVLNYYLSRRESDIQQQQQQQQQQIYYSSYDSHHHHQHHASTRYDAHMSSGVPPLSDMISLRGSAW